MKKSEDIAKAERERKVRDLYKVYNPTNQDFIVKLNIRISPEIWTIKAKTEEIVPMYVMDKYIEEMTDKIIYSKTDAAVMKENEDRERKGFPKMDLHTQQQRFESRKLKSMLTKKDQLRGVLVRGLYKEYGVGDATGVKIDDYQKNIDRRSFATEDEVDSVLGVPVQPKKVEKPVEATSEAPQTEKTAYETKVDNLAKARAAKKVKNANKKN